MHSFNVQKQLGKGTFGTVYLCERKHNKLLVVVKKIDTQMEAKQLEGAKNEVAILRSLKHPNIIRYHDSFLSGGVFHIVMEYATKDTMHAYLAKQRPNLLGQNVVLNFFCQILNGLHCIHSKGIIHRDLKTENIFLTGVKGNIVKIGDFGISKILEDNASANTFIGTTNYVAPEMCHGHPYNTKSDIWSLGCILYELCALERMYEGPVSKVVFSIFNGDQKSISFEQYSPALQVLIYQMLQQDPAYRPDTVRLMSDPTLGNRIYCVGLNLGCIVAGTS